MAKERIRPTIFMLVTLAILFTIFYGRGETVQAGTKLGAKYVTGNIPALYYCTFVKTDKSEPYDLISSATLEKLGPGYRVLEGGGTDGTYAYFCIWNKAADNCKIIKIKLNGGKTPAFDKASDILDIKHGNDVAWDSKNNRLVVVHCVNSDNLGRCDVSFVDPIDLTASKRTDDVFIPEDIQMEIKTRMQANNTTSLYSNMKVEDIPIGLDGIKYNAKRDQYVILLKDTSDFLILDSDFNYVSYLKTQTRNDYVNQGIDCTDDYIVMCQSRKNKSDGNILSIYKWDDGSYVRKVELRGMRNDYELENIFHVGNVIYASCYYNNHTKDPQHQFAYLYTFGRTENVYGVSMKKTSFRIHPYARINLPSYINVIPAAAKNKKVIITSTNPQVASVNSNGLVTGNKVGTTTMKIRTAEGNYETSCTVTVWKDTPKAPKSLKVKKNNKKRKAKITWKKVGAPTGYRVWVSKKKNFKKNKKYLITGSNKRTFLLKKMKRGQKYYVKVQSYIRYGKDYYFSKFSKVKKIKISK